MQGCFVEFSSPDDSSLRRTIECVNHVAALKRDGTLTPSKSFAFISDSPCPHHFPEEAGDPLFDVRQASQQETQKLRSIEVIRRWLKSLLMPLLGKRAVLRSR